MKKVVKEDDVVVLVDSKYNKYIIDTKGKTDKFKGIGVIDPKSLVGKEYGKKTLIGSKDFWILSLSIKDKLECIKRKAQIILPRDSAQIIMNCAIESGNIVLEAGIGSGSLTIALANAVAPSGNVISYDIREDFIKHATKNIKKSGYENLVLIKKKDITKDIDENNLDAIILDIPNPWDAVENCWKSLKIGGYLCSYSPLSTQVEKTVNNLKKQNFIEIGTFENIQRKIVVNEYGMRPSFEMLGHTGYITYARKIL